VNSVQTFQTVVHGTGDINYNVFAQGWLFRGPNGQFPPEEGQGFSLYPLIGFFQAQNIRVSAEVNAAGLDCFRFADQHTHLVSEVLDLGGFDFVDESWHFGGDMAAFELIDPRATASAILVVVDYEGSRLSLTDLSIVNAP